MQICLVNVKYSPNLGDGLLAECLESMLLSGGQGKYTIVSLDLAGRTAYGNSGRARQSILKRIDSMPYYLRYMVLNSILKVFSLLKWKPHYKKLLAGSDVIVLGGGNLFSDVDWNFPTKISLVLSIAIQNETPMHIYGVGVSDKWSNRGLTLLRRELSKANIKSIFVRDKQSKSNFEKYFFSSSFDSPAVKVVRDPGLFVSKLYSFSNVATNNAKSGTDDTREKIGLCITSALAVRHHSSELLSDEFLLDWYRKLYERIIGAGHDCLVFTNGSSEDVEFAYEALSACTLDLKKTTVMLAPESPRELAEGVSSCTIVVAFRMHALIAAYSYGVDIIALKWDGKVEAFMGSIDMPENLMSVVEISPEELMSKIENNLINHMNEFDRQKVLSDTEMGIRSLICVVESDNNLIPRAQT